MKSLLWFLGRIMAVIRMATAYERVDCALFSSSCASVDICKILFGVYVERVLSTVSYVSPSPLPFFSHSRCFLYYREL